MYNIKVVHVSSAPFGTYIYIYVRADETYMHMLPYIMQLDVSF